LLIEIKRFESPDEMRAFDKGAFAVVRCGGLSIGRATYQSGWRWSHHVGPIAGTAGCQVEHVGMVVSGRSMIAMDSGEERVVRPGDVFHVPPGHDSWVVGDEPYVSLHFLGADEYASK